MKLKNTIGLVIGQLTLGGAEKQITKTAIGLQKQGYFNVIVFCLSSATTPYMNDLLERGIKCIAYPSDKTLFINKLWWLISEVKQNRCDLVYGFLHTGNIYAGLACTFLKIPYITSIRSANSSFPFLLKNLSKYFLQNSNAVVVNSNACLRTLREEFRILHPRVYLIKNIIEPITTNQQERIFHRARWNIDDSSLVIGTIALLKEEKRPDLFISICEEINSLIPATFIWVGDGPEKVNIEKCIDKLPDLIKDRIHLEGYQNDIGSYLSALDIFLITSKYEGSPNALLEALSANKICIATKAPGIDELFVEQQIDKQIGILCNSTNPKEIAVKILNVWQDKKLISSLQINAQEWIQENYLSDSIMESLHDVFSKVLKTI